MIIENLCTIFGLGKISKAPGTLGSIVGLVLGIMVIYFSNRVFSQYSSEYILLVETVIISLLFILGAKTSSLYIRKYQIEDPKEIIIDEVVAQILTLFVNYYLINKYLPVVSKKEMWIICYLSSFILFRVCDIAKFWPINWFDDNVKGGIGVMLDDIVAGIFSVLSFSVILIIYEKMTNM